MDNSYLEWLGSIPGSDPERARRIAERFPTYDQLRSATRAELASIEGLTPAAVDDLLRLLGNTTADELSYLFLCPKCGSFVGTGSTTCAFCGVEFEGASESNLSEVVAETARATPGGKGVGKDFLTRWQRMTPSDAPASEADRLLEELDDYDRLLEADATLERAWANRAKILEKLGRHREAAESLVKAADLNPAREDQYRLEVQNVLRATSDAPAQPPRWEQPAATATPKVVAMRLLDALAHYESLLQANPSLVVAWRTKAKILNRLGRTDEARASANQAKRLEQADDRSLRAAVAGLRSSGLATPGLSGTGHTDGRTNGTRNGRTNGRVNGRTNGRVNGLVEGRRNRLTTGAVNGLTNGRVNGLTNGRVNGLPGGRRGRTNGLTNGLRGRTNGLTNGLGWTNGITNGLGRTNGLTNGLGSGRLTGFRSSGFRGMMRTAGWKLYVIPLVVVGLVLMPLFFVPEYNGPNYPIRIDGEFGDWQSVALLDAARAPSVPPNIDLVRFGVTDNVDYLAFYFEVAGTALAGGGPPTTMDSFRAFLDVDRSSDTGYLVAGLGADRLLEVSGAGGAVRAAVLSEWDTNRNPLDWNGWIKSASVYAAVTGTRVEAQVDWQALVSQKQAIDVAFHAMAYDGFESMGAFSASTTAGSLRIVETPTVPETISGATVALTRLELTAAVREVAYDSLTITRTGTAPVGAISGLRLVDGFGADLGLRIPVFPRVTFQFPTRTLAAGSTETLVVVADAVATAGQTLGARIERVRDIDAGPAAVSITRQAGTGAVGYLGTVPSQPIVDGGFSEWMGMPSDATGEPGVPSRIDLSEYGFSLGGSEAFAYVRVVGRALDGAVVPASPAALPIDSGPTVPDSDRDTVPDGIDPMPNDFNNDGIDDVLSGNDYDGDGVIDYPAGPDTYLNTTIPATFPAPYAGRPVSVFIGPTFRPVVLGEDVARIFFDADDDTGTGYRIGPVGADYLVEIRGKDGTAASRTLSIFVGPSQAEWTFAPLESVQTASDLSRLEIAFPIAGRGFLNTSRAYFEMYDWKGQFDTNGGPSSRQFTRGAVIVETQDIGGNGRYSLRNTNHATETACTVNKVASTGDSGAAVTTTLTTGQSACWYLDDTSGQNIPSGSWEVLLDINHKRQNGVLAYGEGSVSTPRYRTWDGSAFSGESSAATAAGTIQWVVIKSNPVKSDEKVMALQASNDDVYVQTWDGFSWTANWNTDLGGNLERRFDVAYERGTGDVLVVFSDGSSTLKYRKRVGGTWDTSNQNAGTALDDLAFWVRAESRPTNDDIFVGVVTNGQKIHGLRWDGSSNAWANQTQMTATPTSKATEVFDIAFERSSGDAFLIWGDSSKNLKYREFTNAWQTETDAYATMPDNHYWVTAAYDPLSSSSKIVVGMILNNGNLEWGAWDGSSWVSRPSAVAGRDKLERGIDVAFEDDTGEAVFGFVQSSPSNQLSFRIWTSSGGFGTVTSASGTSGSINFVQLTADPFSDSIMALYADTNNDLFHRVWSGSSWSSIGTALETGLSVSSKKEAFMFAWNAATAPEYDVYFEIWNKDTNSVSETIGSCLDRTTYGDDVQCLVSSVASKSLSSSQVVRVRISHSSSANTVHIDYDDSDSTGDSRATIPLPEFAEVVIPIVGTTVLVLLARKRRALRRRPRA